MALQQSQLLVDGILGSISCPEVLLAQVSPRSVGGVRIPDHNNSELLASQDLASNFRRKRDLAARDNGRISARRQYHEGAFERRDVESPNLVSHHGMENFVFAQGWAEW